MPRKATVTRRKQKPVTFKEFPFAGETPPEYERGVMIEQLSGCMDSLLRYLGFEDEPGMQDTPKRFAKYLMEFNQELDVAGVLKDGFEFIGEKSIHSMVVQKDIPFVMICEHHLLPAIGVADFGYIPNKKVIGISKIPRLIDGVCHNRPSLQEVISERIVDEFDKHVEPKGVILVVKAKHSCMGCRGVKTPEVATITSSIRGVFRDVAQARSEFFSLVS